MAGNLIGSIVTGIAVAVAIYLVYGMERLRAQGQTGCRAPS